MDIKESIEGIGHGDPASAVAAGDIKVIIQEVADEYREMDPLDLTAKLKTIPSFPPFEQCEFHWSIPVDRVGLATDFRAYAGTIVIHDNDDYDRAMEWAKQPLAGKVGVQRILEGQRGIVKFMTVWEFGGRIHGITEAYEDVVQGISIYDKNGLMAQQIALRIEPAFMERVREGLQMGGLYRDDLTLDENIEMAIFDMFVNPCMLATTYMHCKNVHVVDEPPVSRQVKRMRQRKAAKGQPLDEYKVLAVTSGGRVIEYLTGHKAKRGSNRQHTVRGNIAIYTKERPLFGRITGPVYRPPHVRGNRAKGRIDKDYEVKVGRKADQPAETNRSETEHQEPG
jgi:hypothetical protein